jgi:hypothetical protein
MLSPAQLADRLGVGRAFVYAHADELGAIRLGSGPKARLRFDAQTAFERLSACSLGRTSLASEPSQKPVSRRRRRSAMGTNVQLLPIRGRALPESGAPEAA